MSKTVFEKANIFKRLYDVELADKKMWDRFDELIDTMWFIIEKEEKRRAKVEQLLKKIDELGLKNYEDNIDIPADLDVK